MEEKEEGVEEGDEEGDDDEEEEATCRTMVALFWKSSKSAFCCTDWHRMLSQDRRRRRVCVRR